MPAGYVALEYLSGSLGSITTGIYLTLSDIVFVDFAPTVPTLTNSSAEYSTIFTDRTTKGAAPYAWGVYIQYNSSSKVWVNYRLARNNTNVFTSSADQIAVGTRVSRFIYNAFRLDSDGSLLPAIVAQTGPIALLRCAYYGAWEDIYKEAHLLYQFAVYSNDGQLRHNLLPCTNPSGVSGLYDTVDAVFYPVGG